MYKKTIKDLQEEYFSNIIDELCSHLDNGLTLPEVEDYVQHDQGEKSIIWFDPLSINSLNQQVDVDQVNANKDTKDSD